ncbi:MAG: JAB domain-containing protein [Flavobacteriaceae bacterium]|nr:JAB domain-containing protein [Flavobacteriaceae bacterium]
MENREKLEYGDLAEVSVSYLYKSDLKSRPKITNPYDAFQVAWRVIDKDLIGIQEQFLAIYLNISNKVIGTRCHFCGGISSVTVDIKILLVTAIKLMASSIIVAHNHPSGVLKPSDQDLRLTGKLKEALKLLDIELFDHLIISPEGNFISIIN